MMSGELGIYLTFLKFKVYLTQLYDSLGTKWAILSPFFFSFSFLVHWKKQVYVGMP